MTYCPPQVSETPDLPVEDCAPSSDLMAANKATLGRYPANRTEREKIRTATGKPHGGLTVADLNKANKSLFGHELETLSIPFQSFLDGYMTNGYGACLLGNAHNLPAHYNRWDPHFGQQPMAGHAVYVQADSPSGQRRMGGGHLTALWWMNPLAPWDYGGEWIDVASVRAYAWGIGQSGLVKEGAWIDISGGGIDVPGLDVTDIGPGGGTVTVQGAGHAFVRLRDKAVVPVASGFTKPVLRRVHVRDTYNQDAWLVGDDLAVLFVKDTTQPAPDIKDCAAEIAADRTKAYVAWKP